ncbi:MAG: hypothetical protein H0X37_05125 [Herpetosiphonaceae bacterium]|nr:hypothetical protein [Herpetosiphonaceae bacterium]
MTRLVLLVSIAPTDTSLAAARPSTTMTTIPVGSSPFDIAVNRRTNRAYTANYGDNTVSVITGQ